MAGTSRPTPSLFRCALFLAAGSFLLPNPLLAQPNRHLPQPPLTYGPYNALILPDGDGIRKPIEPLDSLVFAGSPWTISCWFHSSDSTAATTLIAGFGNATDEDARYLGIQDGKLVLWMGPGDILSAPAAPPETKAGWRFAAATFDGKLLHLYEGSTEVASAPPTFLSRVSPALQIAPSTSAWPKARHFGGKVAALTIVGKPSTAGQIAELSAPTPDFSLIEYETGTGTWPIQTRGQAGYSQPQDPSILPHSKAAFSQPVGLPVKKEAALALKGNEQWTIAGGWKLTPAPKVSATAEAISQTGFDTQAWWAATVPGTVLTTMIDRGIYPDPDYGLNNLAIPETLNKQDYWYRVEFPSPKTARHQLLLTMNGINYAAEVWLNGKHLGEIKGAFIRGAFDVTGLLMPGRINTLAIRISPPPHPGIPNEESIKGGPGDNGGIMALDGPTFMATEGWDWIPGIRDRNTGLWQDVSLTASGSLRLGDAQVITKLPLPDTSKADVRIAVPVKNLTDKPVKATLTAAFDDVSVTKSITLVSGESTIDLTPAEFAQLTVQNPRLWWPNGYGKPELHTLKLTISADGNESDTEQLNFGIREVTYEVSLYDATGHLRRVEVSPTTARLLNQQVVDVSHEGMKALPRRDPKQDYPDWVSSMVPGAENSPAFTRVATPTGSTDLVIKVNGVRIAARGGNWGMDDSRKRVSREHLEPYFRLHRDANLNIIRNWMGQNTEETFYDLADEYGLMIWNDFWDSTQNYNLEAQDPALFLANARDSVMRFRNHPSIVMWCGRNEGVPQPIITDGLSDLLTSLDGTRYYSPSSNQVNLRNSGPYQFKTPETYYEINRGFSVELGVPSLPTLESWKAWIPEADQWPVSDSWAYHDWHQSGNGDVEPFMLEVEKEFGAATDLEDFERKAQMLNYTEHRALFEGFNAHLWEPSSGRLLWMTQPAWPSSSWQILSSDYDTQASFYGVRKACEPIHVQLDLTSYQIDVINTTTSGVSGLALDAKVYSLTNQVMLDKSQPIESAADAATHAFRLDLAPLLSSGVVFIKLSLTDSNGKVVSDNLYWLGKDSYALRQLTKLDTASVSITPKPRGIVDGMEKINISLHNESKQAALETKLTLENADDGSRILPAYYSDNYISLLPNETRQMEIEYPAEHPAKLAVYGWNIKPLTVPLLTQ